MSSDSRCCNLDVNQEKIKIRELRAALSGNEYCQQYVEGEYEKLLGVLRIKYFNVEKAAVTIQNYEHYLRKHGRGVSLEDCNKAFTDDIFSVLKERDNDGSQVFNVRIKNWHPNENSFEAGFNAASYVFDEMLLIKETQLNGVVVIFDFQDVGYTQLAKQIATIRLPEIKRTNSFSKDGSIIKLKYAFVLNAPYAVTQMMKVVKLILSKKIMSRVKFCRPDSEEFITNFQKEKLPKSLGGILNEEDAKDLELVKKIFKKESDIYSVTT